MTAWGVAVPVVRILGDWPPAGRYAVEASLGVSGYSVQGLPAGTIELRPSPT